MDLFTLSHLHTVCTYTAEYAYENHNNKLSLTAPTIICRLLYMSNSGDE